MTLNKIIKILEEAKEGIGYERYNKIKEFQRIVWDDNTIEDVFINDLLAQLAYDFDYYEPDESKRKEELSYYGDEQLLKELKLGLEKLKELKKLKK